MEFWLHTKTFDGETFHLIDNLSSSVLIATDISGARSVLCQNYTFWYFLNDLLLEIISSHRGSSPVVWSFIYFAPDYHYFFSLINSNIYLSQFFLANHLFWSLKNLGKCLKIYCLFVIGISLKFDILDRDPAALTANYMKGRDEDWRGRYLECKINL